MKLVPTAIYIETTDTDACGRTCASASQEFNQPLARSAVRLHRNGKTE
jgi:hypothetical protein